MNISLVSIIYEPKRAPSTEHSTNLLLLFARYLISFNRILQLPLIAVYIRAYFQYLDFESFDLCYCLVKSVYLEKIILISIVTITISFKK